MGKIDGDAVFAEHVAEIVKAIGHPVRIRLVAALCAGEANVNALAESLDVRQAIVSQQLRILRMSGLVEVSREGGFATYKLARPRLKDLVRCLEGCTVQRGGK